MKTLSLITFFSCIALVSCNNEPADKLSKIDLPKEKIETPKAQLVEEIISPDLIKEGQDDTANTKEDKAESKDLANKTGTEKKQNQIAATGKPDQTKKPATPKKKKEPTFVKTVSKPIVKQVKRTAEIEFDEYNYDFGEIMEGDKIEHKFSFTNTGRAPLSITKADATCGCATPSIPFMDIMPGEKGFIGIMYNSVGKEGEETPEVTIFSNAGSNPNIVLKLNGYVKTAKEAKAELAVKDSIIYQAKDSIKTQVKKEVN